MTSIANILGGFMVSNTLSLLNPYQIVNDNSAMSDRYIYLYCYLYKTPINPCNQDVILNYFVYFQVVEELPTDSIRQICYGDRRDNPRYGKNNHPISIPSFSDDIVSLVLSSSYNLFFRIVSPYSNIVDLSQKLCNFERSKVEDNYCQKKRKLIINPNVTLKKKQKKLY